MDMLSSILNPFRAKPGERTVVDQGKAWPAIKAVHGKYYIFTDVHKDQMVAQTRATWEQLGTIIEQQRRTMVGQDTAIKQQSDEIRRLQNALSDATDRLNNLRGSHRALLQEKVEAQMPPPLVKAPVFDLFPPPKKD